MALTAKSTVQLLLWESRKRRAFITACSSLVSHLGLALLHHSSRSTSSPLSYSPITVLMLQLAHAQTINDPGSNNFAPSLPRIYLVCAFVNPYHFPACSFKSWMRVVRYEADKKNKPSIIDVCPLKLWGIAGCFKFMEMQMNRLFVHCVLATRSEEVHLHNENFDRKHTVNADCRIFEHFFRSQKAPIVSLGAMTLI